MSQLAIIHARPAEFRVYNLPMHAPAIRPTHAQVSLAAIGNNIRRLRALTGTPVMAVVKANAYGHGAVRVARAALEAGASWLAVAFSDEALALRQAGVQANILVLGYTAPEAALEAIENKLTITVYDAALAQHYAECARALNKRADLHVKVDTGMGRLGVLPADAPRFVSRLMQLPAVRVGGMFTHFATSDEADRTYAYEQLARFNEVIDTLGSNCPPLLHCANSAAALVMPESRLSVVRTGIAMYGMHPSPDVPLPDGFLPALQWRSVVAQVRRVPPRSSISYGREYVTAAHEIIAVVPVGYADGFRRFPKNVARVIVGGKIAPVVGRVCMDQIMVNVSEAGEVRVGDEVVLIGEQGGSRISAEEAAARWGTINYDLTSGIMARVPRVYLE